MPEVVVPAPRKARLRLVALAGFGLAALASAAAVAHLPALRSCLGGSGCPFAATEASAAEVDAVRRLELGPVRGTMLAPARPALGFVLDVSTRADLSDWARHQGVTCEDVRDGLMHCADVPAGALGLPTMEAPVSRLSLAFDERGVLVNMTTLRIHLAQDAAVRTLAGIGARLRDTLGPPHEGALDPERLSRVGAESISQVRYRYRDYVAEVVAMRRAADGIVVREHFLSARDERTAQRSPLHAP